MRNDALDKNKFRYLYTSKMYILLKLMWVCCGYDIIVIYDVIERQTETIRIINAKSLESFIVMDSMDSDWGSDHYCMQGAASQSRIACWVTDSTFYTESHCCRQLFIKCPACQNFTTLMVNCRHFVEY